MLIAIILIVALVAFVIGFFVGGVYLYLGIVKDGYKIVYENKKFRIYKPGILGR